MAEQSLSCFLDGLSFEGVSSRFEFYYRLCCPPPVIARDEKYMSLWRLLNYFDQEKLRSLLKLLEPVDQDCLLSLLEPLNQQGQESLIKVLSGLKRSEQVKLLGILNEHGVLEQQVILKVLNRLYGESGLSWYYILHGFFKDVPNAKTVLSLLKSLHPLDRSKLLRLLDGLDFTHQCKLVSVLERLKQQKQRQLLTLLVGLDSSGQDILLDIIVQLKGQKKRQLLRVLDGLDSSLRQGMLEIMVGLKLKRKKVPLEVLDSLESPKRAEVLKVIHEYHETGLLSLNAQSYLFESGCTMLIPSPLERQKRLVDELDTTLYLGAQVRTYLRAKLRAKLWEVQFLCWLRTLSIDSGGSRNLLLDGWWLEFWEIILLAAGDVERNPGPRRMTAEELSNVDGQVLGKDDIFDVYDAVFDCRAKWNNLCLALRISPGDLSAVEEKRHGDVVACLRDGLSLWLQGCYDKVKYGPPTWRMLVDAVANSAGGDDHSLAMEIAEEHRALPNVQIAISRCDRSSEEMGPVSFGDKHKAHKATHAQSVMKPVEDDCSREESRRGHQQSAAFSTMYGAIARGIGRSLDVDDLRRFLRYFSHPRSSNQRYIQPSLYIGVESTREILDHLYPEYINPENIYLLEEIVSLSNSRQCKRILDEYIKKYPH